jgi:hypothetical protein
MPKFKRFPGLLFPVFAAILCLALSGCNLRGRKVNAEPPPPFHSPFTEMIGRPGMNINEIKKVLLGRLTDDRSLLASLKLTVGQQRSASRQQFDVDAYFAPPDFLRVRGSADAGSVFDFLLANQQVQVLVVPERKAYVGTQAAMRANNTLMAGLQPEDLMNCFFVQGNFYDLLEGYAGGQLTEQKDHYLVTFNYPTGVTEIYSLRMSDLLIDRIDRVYRGKSVGYVRFDGYDYYGKKHLLPTRFEASQPSGAVATVEAVSLTPNAPRTPELSHFEIPQEFQRVPL